MLTRRIGGRGARGTRGAAATKLAGARALGVRGAGGAALRRACRGVGAASAVPDAGAFYVDLLIGSMVFIALVLSFLAVPEILAKKQELDYIARNVVRKIEREGEAGRALWQSVNDMRRETGVDADIELNGAFSGAGAKLQIREKFRVTASYTVRLRLFEPTFAGPVYMDVPIRKTLSGVSEVYWKDLY